MIRFLFCLLIIPQYFFAQSYKDSLLFANRRLEVSMNVTSTISTALGNSTVNSQLADPYLFGLKLRMAKSIYLRSAFNFKQRKALESNNSRTINESTRNVRLGFEYREQLMKKLFVYYGIDAVYNSEESDAVSFNFQAFNLNTVALGYGGGPMLGLLYSFNSRVAISTEASLYYLNTKTTFSVNGKKSRESNGYLLNPIIPSSIYIIINF